MKLLSRLILMLLCAAVAACGQSNDARAQHVVGKVAYIGEPPAQRKVKLLSLGESGCAGAGDEVTTDRDGAFKLIRTIAFGNLADSLQTDMLCIETLQGWVPVWQDSYEPAPTMLDIFCAGTIGAWKCEVFGDGVSLVNDPK